MSNAEKAIQILQLTDDGNKLSPRQLHLLESAVNNILSEAGQQEFNNLYLYVLQGDYKQWFHDIEYLDKSHQGYVYWKGILIEHYSYQDYEKEKADAQRLASKCKYLESINVKVSSQNLWDWDKYQPS